MVVILGPSGCGKSTLLRCINGLEQIQGGSISLAGVGELGKDLAWTQVRQEVGMVFQNYELFGHMNVIDNILLGPVKAQKRSRLLQVLPQVNTHLLIRQKEQVRQNIRRKSK